MLHTGALDELTDDAIAGTFRVWQRRRGHRYSLDDVATAWEAAGTLEHLVAGAADDPRPGGDSALTLLDLGCGIGSVLTMLAHRFPRAHLTGVEAQEISFELAERNVERNDLGGRVALCHADLRDHDALRALAGAPFDLITGTPPYFRPKDGTLPPDSQKAHARVELRGGVEDYLAAAATVLAPGGRVVVCAGARAPERALDGGRAAGLAVLRRRDVVPRAGKKGPLFSVFTFGPGPDRRDRYEHAAPLIARDADGARTPAAHELRRFFGLPVNEAEAPSP